jgi:hypothetical protein
MNPTCELTLHRVKRCRFVLQHKAYGLIERQSTTLEPRTLEVSAIRKTVASSSHPAVIARSIDAR